MSNDHENAPTDAGNDDRVADENVERLLARSYEPETPSPEFEQRVIDAMLAARPAARPVRRLQPIFAAAAAALIAAGLWGIVSSSTGPVRPRGPVPVGLGSDPLRTTADARDFDADRSMPNGMTAAAAPGAVHADVFALGDVITGSRERRRLALPDGSVLFVNAQSRVSFLGDRRLRLDQGEAFLDVAPRSSGDSDGDDAQETFTLETPDRTVTALGTRFRVRVDDGASSVLVTQGSVRVSGVEGLVHAGQVLDGSTIGPAPRATHALGWMRDLVAASQSPLVPRSDHSGGSLIAVDPQGQEMRLSLRRYHVDVHIEDGFARTTIDQTFFNHAYWRMEGTFHFPLPADASLSRLAMYVAGDLMEGGMAERSHARDVYEEIRHTRRDPALLEWVDGSTFKMRVFPLEPREEKRLLLSYTQRLTSEYGRTTYRFPAGHSFDEVGEWSTAVRVDDGAGRPWTSDSHELAPQVDGDDLVLRAEEQDTRPDRDLVVHLESPSDAGDAVQSRTFVHEGARYLLVRWTPDLPGQARRERRDWTFLFESSASRDPVLARTQIEVLRELLLAAEHDDTFRVLVAGTRVTPLDADALPATRENIESAIEFVETTHLVGALDLAHALGAVQTVSATDANPWIVHLGGGVATIGERAPDVLANSLSKSVPYVGVAVGKRWSRPFMRSAAARTGGHVVQIHPDQLVAWRAQELAAVLDAPRLLDVRVEADTPFLSFTDGLVQGESFAAITRLGDDTNLPSTVSLRGLLDGAPFEDTVRVPAPVDGAGYLPRQWAKLEIDRLLADDAQKHQERITKLSKAMYVMSPFTSLLVLENEAMYAQFNVDRGRKDHWALYPAPEKIEVVRQWGNERRAPEGDRDTASDPLGETLSTTFVRIPPTLFPRGSVGRWHGDAALSVRDLQVIAAGGGRFRWETSTYGDYDGVSRLGARLRDAGQPSGGGGEAVGAWGRPDHGMLSAAELPLAAEQLARSSYRYLTGDSGGGGGGNPSRTGGGGTPYSVPGIYRYEGAVRGVLAFGRDEILDQLSGSGAGLSVTEQATLERLSEWMPGGGGGGNFGKDDLEGWSDFRRRIGTGGDWGGFWRFGGGGGGGGARTLNALDPLVGGAGAGGFSANQQGMTLFQHGQFLPPASPDRVRESGGGAGGGAGGAFGRVRVTFDDLFFGAPGNPAAGRRAWEAQRATVLAGRYSHAQHRPHTNAASFDHVLYERPVFGGDARVFRDLLQYAPGMNTTTADIRALAEEERGRPDSGTVDDAARALIDRARSHGWRRGVSQDSRGRKVAVTFDGQGRFTIHRPVGGGLREVVWCDGETLLHLYSEIGVGARRKTSRFHHTELSRFIPWALRSADDLAIGADVVLVSESVVAIRQPLPENADSEAPAYELHLVFAAHGRLAERRIVERGTGKVAASETYDLRGHVSIRDHEDEEIGKFHVRLHEEKAPPAPRTDQLVILPLPYRTTDERILVNLDQMSKWSEEQALERLSGLLIHNPWPAKQIVARRFLAGGDRRLGFYTLLIAFGGGWVPDQEQRFGNVTVLMDPRAGNEDSALADHLANQLQWMHRQDWELPRIGSPRDGFVQRLAEFAALQDLWHDNRAKTQPDEVAARVAALVRSLPGDPLGWAVLMQWRQYSGRRAKDAALYAELVAEFADVPGLAYVARYEQACGMTQANQSKEAAKLFRTIHSAAVERGGLPRIDAQFAATLKMNRNGRPSPWSRTMRATADRMLEQDARAAVLHLAHQVAELGDRLLSDALVERALDGADDDDRRSLLLLAMELAWHHERYGDARHRLGALLADDDAAPTAAHWWLDSTLARKTGDFGGALRSQVRAMDLEFADLPDVVDVSVIRAQYRDLLEQYQRAGATLGGGEGAPADFVAAVVRATDRWRSIDPDATEACARAAEVFRAAGEEEKAWEYLTTPLDLRPNESGPWVALAEKLVSHGDAERADEAYRTAFEIEPTNAQILFDHARFRQLSGDRAGARVLYRQVADGSWQPRFSGLMHKAEMFLDD